MKATDDAMSSSDHSLPQSLPQPNTLPEAVPVVNPNPGTPQEERGTLPNVQTQAKKLRDTQRQIMGPEVFQSVEPDQYEPPAMQDSGSIPRELKYLVHPRGPPRYGRDADVPLAEQETPADLLERLRYSIAPRGPSLVTAEMQSPECQFSSGPRISSENVRFQMVG
jgi:hypothetical protein